jgi:hypothetical protein
MKEKTKKLKKGRLPLYVVPLFVILLFLYPVSDSLSEEGFPKYYVAPPPFSEGIYPCSNCHSAMPVNPERRELSYHQNIVLKNHAEDQRWCLDCHNPDDRDKLRLASGELISFEESYRLCGQCHGPVYRDWRVGVHGKRTGYWNGEKLYRLCAQCHNPHNPKFRAVTPLPPPKEPEKLKYMSKELKKRTYRKIILPDKNEQYVPEKH